MYYKYIKIDVKTSSRLNVIAKRGIVITVWVEIDKVTLDKI